MWIFTPKFTKVQISILQHKVSRKNSNRTRSCKKKRSSFTFFFCSLYFSLCFLPLKNIFLGTGTKVRMNFFFPPTRAKKKQFLAVSVRDFSRMSCTKEVKVTEGLNEKNTGFFNFQLLFYFFIPLNKGLALYVKCLTFLEGRSRNDYLRLCLCSFPFFFF